MKYKFVENHQKLFPIEKMCQVLKISASGYYKWKKKSPSDRTLQKDKLKQQIMKLYFAFKQRYGAPRLTMELHALGYKTSRITVSKYMKEMGLRSKLSRKFKATTDSKHNYLVVKNVLDRNFMTLQNQKFGFLTLLTSIQQKDFCT